MKLAEHYVQLRNSLSHVMEQQDVKVTIDELADYLCCTPRYTKKIINEMKKIGWIHWEVAYGRGKRPTLTFLKNKEEMVLAISKLHMKSGRYKEGLELLHEIGPQFQQNVHRLLEDQFGYIEDHETTEALEVLRYPFYHSIIHLDPAHINSIHENHLVDHIFDTLLNYNNHTKKVEPHLAHHYESTSNGIEWTFHLRKGVYFHHGRELTAHDIILSFQRLQTIDFHNKSLVSNIKEIKMVKKWVVQFQLKSADYLFPNALCHKQLSIIPVEIYERGSSQFSKLPIGTGSFKITKHDDSIIRLDAHQNYFKGRPHLDRVEIITLPDLSQQLKNDFSSYFSHNTTNNAMCWEEVSQPEEGATYITFNLHKGGVHQSSKIRQAINHAIDREALCDYLGGKHLFPADSQLIAETKRMYQKAYNLMKAKELLREARYHGETITLYGTQLRKNASVKREALWIKEQCEKIGIRMEVFIQPINDLLKKQVLYKADMVIGGVAFGNDIVFSYYRYFQMPASFVKNLMGKRLEKTIDMQLEKVRQTPDLEQQLNDLLDLERLLKRETAIIHLYHRSHAITVKQQSTLQGVSLESFGRIDYRKLWFK